MSANPASPSRQIGRPAPVFVEDFRGDYEQLQAMIETSWAQNESPPLLYEAGFLADCFGYPGASFALAPAIYRDTEIVTFSAGLPRRMVIEGSERRLVLSSFLTVAPSYKSRGYGVVAWSELARRAAQSGFDGIVNYCVEGEAMNRIIDGCCRRIGIPNLKVAAIPYLSRVLWPKRSDSAGKQSGASVEGFLSAAAKITRGTPMARVWSAEEARWQLQRFGGVSVQGGEDGDPAVLTGYVMPIADRARTPCLVVEDVLWGSLDPGQCATMVRELLAQATAMGARIAIVPSLGYAPTEPFAACGFRPSQRVVNCYLSIWEGSMPSAPPAAWYLDVL